MNTVRRFLAMLVLVVSISSTGNAQECGGQAHAPSFPASVHGQDDLWPFRYMRPFTWDESFHEQNGWTMVREGERWYYLNDETGELVGPFIRVTGFDRFGGEVAAGATRDEYGSEELVWIKPDGEVQSFNDTDGQGPCCGQQLKSEHDWLKEGEGQPGGTPFVQP